jgi:proteasome lid subunit RPN8/RPN11
VASIQIQNEILAAMMDHARSDLAKECCGLLAGRHSRITKIFAATNASPDPSKSYEIAPLELFAHMRAIRAAHLDFLGIYHSHPSGDNAPSRTDIARAYYPDVAYFILSPSASAPPATVTAHPVRAFEIKNATVTELEIQIVG